MMNVLWALSLESIQRNLQDLLFHRYFMVMRLNYFTNFVVVLIVLYVVAVAQSHKGRVIPAWRPGSSSQDSGLPKVYAFPGIWIPASMPE